MRPDPRIADLACPAKKIVSGLEFTSARRVTARFIETGKFWSSVEEGIFLTRFAKRVTIATQDDQLTASKVVSEKVAEHPKIDVLPNTTVAEFRGTKKLETVILKNTKTGERSEIHPAGVFAFIGLRPNTGFVKGLVETDDRGFIMIDGSLETNVSGIFAAGDCRTGSTKQATSAADEGAAVALGIRRYVEPRVSLSLSATVAAR